MREKLKQFLMDDSLFYTVIIVLVGLTSFGLGRHTVVPEVKVTPATNATAAVVESVAPVGIETEDTTESNELQLVGSVNGNKYHALWCPGASQIKETNKVFFASVTDAEAAGYTKAANCAGL